MEKGGGMGRDGGAMEWCRAKEGRGAELTHLSSSLPMSSSLPVSSSPPMSLLSPLSSLFPLSSMSPVSMHGCWQSFVSHGGCCGWSRGGSHALWFVGDGLGHVSPLIQSVGIHKNVNFSIFYIQTLPYT